MSNYTTFDSSRQTSFYLSSKLFPDKILSPNAKKPPYHIDMVAFYSLLTLVNINSYNKFKLIFNYAAAKLVNIFYCPY